LGNDPSSWSRNCPLPKPAFFSEALAQFILAFKAAENGDSDLARKLLDKTQDDELRSWYIEHGQMSGWHHRVKALNLPLPKSYQGIFDNPKIPEILSHRVFKRDGYHCRYCESRVIDERALKRFQSLIGKEYFQYSGKSNQIRHGIALNFRATADHVVPIKRGGKTQIENLVTSCWSCNYGKLNALVEQMGIDDPRTRPPILTEDWSGLISQ
jgi:5-methylcytosine-specific restriction endonuclease McrA